MLGSGRRRMLNPRASGYRRRQGACSAGSAVAGTSSGTRWCWGGGLLGAWAGELNAACQRQCVCVCVHHPGRQHQWSQGSPATTSQGAVAATSMPRSSRTNLDVQARSRHRKGMMLPSKQASDAQNKTLILETELTKAAIKVSPYPRMCACNTSLLLVHLCGTRHRRWCAAPGVVGSQARTRRPTLAGDRWLTGSGEGRTRADGK